MSRFLSYVIVLALLGLYPAAAAASSKEELAADILTGVIPLGAYGIAYARDDSEGQQQWLYSTATSLALNTAARVAFNETRWGERPNGHPYGFPSGHTSFVVSGAAFLQERYGWQYGVPAYLGAAYVSYVRVDTDHHRWRDIVAAAGLSWGVARMMVTAYEGEHARLTPLIGPRMLGLYWEYSW